MSLSLLDFLESNLKTSDGKSTSGYFRRVDQRLLRRSDGVSFDHALAAQDFLYSISFEM